MSNHKVGLSLGANPLLFFIEIPKRDFGNMPSKFHVSYQQYPNLNVGLSLEIY